MSVKLDLTKRRYRRLKNNYVLSKIVWLTLNWDHTLYGWIMETDQPKRFDTFKFIERIMVRIDSDVEWIYMDYELENYADYQFDNW